MTTFLTPSPKQQFFTAAGVPLVGGKVYTYAAGTSTPLATYQDSTGNVSNTNPIILDSRGECNLWLLPANAYKFILRDSADALIWTVDNINLGINFSNVIITGGSINGVTIGNIAPGTAVFTDLTATGTVTFNGVTQMQIPAGPTANRSTTPVDGMIRYNSTTDQYEGNTSVTGQAISTLQLTGTVTAILTTATPHGLSDGDRVTIRDIVGTVEANGTWIIDDKTSNTFDLVDSAFATTYSSGGEWTLAAKFDYTYSIALPADCLRVLRVNDNLLKPDWRVEAGRIVTNDDLIELKYIYDVTDYTTMSVDFYECLALYIATDVCLPLTQNDQRKAELKQEFQLALSKARHSDATEDSAEQLEANEWIASRFTSPAYRGYFSNI